MLSTSRRLVIALALGVLALVIVVVVVTTSGDDDQETPAASESCRTQGTQATQALADDRAAVPGQNWVPVVREDEVFRDRLLRLDKISRAISDADFDAVLNATERRGRAVRTGVADVPAKGAGRSFALVVPDDEGGEAIGSLYEEALERQGSETTVDPAPVEDALAAVRDGDADVALVPLGALGEWAGADVPAGADLSTQVQLIAQAAFEDRLVLGATSSASLSPVVLVPGDVVGNLQATTLSELAAACSGARIAAAEGADDAASAVAQTYGFELSGETVEDPDEVFAEESEFVAVVVAS